MFYDNIGGISVLLLVLAIVTLFVTFRENLTGNAPKELPLPSELDPNTDTGRIGTYDKRFLDKREIPTGTSDDTSYLLSPETVQARSMDTNAEPVQITQTDVQILQSKIDRLTTELENMKRTMQASTSQAAAAQASLGAIPNTGVNMVAPLV